MIPASAVAMHASTLGRMAMEHDVQRLELGDVVLVDLEDGAGEVEAKVARAIDRTDTTVRVRCESRDARTS